MKNKEKADEDIYISRMEKEAMKVLWTKIDKKIPEDTTNPEIILKDRQSLIGIMKKHNLKLSEALIGDILVWKLTKH